MSVAFGYCYPMTKNLDQSTNPTPDPVPARPVPDAEQPDANPPTNGDEGGAGEEPDADHQVDPG